jgi:hypothetical protein
VDPSRYSSDGYCICNSCRRRFRASLTDGLDTLRMIHDQLLAILAEPEALRRELLVINPTLFYAVMEDLAEILDHVGDSMGVLARCFPPGVEEMVFCPRCLFRGRERMERAMEETRRGYRWLDAATTLNMAVEVVVIGGGEGSMTELAHAVEAFVTDAWRGMRWVMECWSWDIEWK